jgi:peptidoglycan/LPS O-acetylase OafA/YrhL
MVRRWFRIAPMYYTGIALFAAIHFGSQFGAASMTVEPFTAVAVAANLLFVHGFVPSANNVIVPGGWSIGTEMAFYALFPILIGPFQRLGRDHGLRALVALVLAAVAVNLAIQAATADAFGAPGNNSFAYFNILNQLPVFLVGMLLFRWHDSRPTAGAAAGAAVFVVATAAALGLWRSGIAPAFALVPVVAGLAYAGLGHALSRSRLDLAWLRSIGQVSFSMYVVHTVFAWHVERALTQPLTGLQLPPDAQCALLYAMVVLASYAVARVTDRVIESPGVALGSRLCARIGAPPAHLPGAPTPTVEPR